MKKKDLCAQHFFANESVTQTKDKLSKYCEESAPSISLVKSKSLNFGKVLALFHNRGRNMDLPQHTVDQVVVETRGFSKQIGTEEGGFVTQQRHGYSFLRRPQISSHPLPSRGKNNQWADSS